MRFHLFLGSALVIALAGIHTAQATTVVPDPSKQQAPAAEAVAPSPKSVTTNQPPSAVPVTQAPTAPAATKPASVDHHLTANRFILATNVVHHEPQGTKEQFQTSDGHIFAFAELSTKGNDHVAFHWKKDGKTYHERKMNVKDSPRWRTYSSVRALPGNWSVALLDSHGTVVKEISFTIAGNGAHHSPASPKAKAAAPTEADKVQKQPESVKEVLTALEPANGAKATK